MFVHKNGEPLEKAVEALSSYLGALTSYFLKNDYCCPYQEDICFEFFYYALQLYAYNRVGNDSFDDLIRLAELFQNDVDVLTVVLAEDLPEDIVNEWTGFVTENEYVPRNFPEAVTGAVAVFLGVLKDPIDN